MSKARLIITAVVLEGRSKSQVAPDYDVSATGFSNWPSATSPRARPRTGRGRDGRTPALILNILDDHSRLALASVPRRTITGPDVLRTFQDAFLRWGIPASVLTDNGAVCTGLPRRGGRVALEIELGRLGIRFDHSRANHPQTPGR